MAPAGLIIKMAMHATQQAKWIPAHKALSLILLDKANYEALKNEVEKIAKFTGTESDGTRTYEGKNFFYTIQVVDFNEPLQKSIHLTALAWHLCNTA